MKKLFIGCGVLVVLILGVLGWAVYQVYPDASEGQELIAAAFTKLEELDQSYPFEAEPKTQLDGQRFVKVLEIRVDQATYLRGVVDDLGALAEQFEEGEEPGWIDSFKLIIRATRQSFLLMGEASTKFAENLAAAQMGPKEFAWNTKVLWACLRRVDQGAGEPGLDDLRGRFDEFEVFYVEQRENNKDLPVLGELIGNVSPAAIAQASDLLASDIERVKDGLYAPQFDHLYLLLPAHQLEELEVVVEPGGTGDPAGR
ncbi:MAG: hypothetical protein ACYTCU_00010 [Planctomycetota bacterium]|jgi:hypothetical protein